MPSSSDIWTREPSLRRRAAVVLDTLAISDAGEDLHLFTGPICRNKEGDRLADNLLRAMAEQAFGSTIPGGDDAVEIDADGFTDQGSGWNNLSGLPKSPATLPNMRTP